MAKNTGVILGLIGLGAAALFISRKKGDEIKNLSVSVSDVSAKFSSPNVILNLNLAVYNPNTNAVQFQKFLGNLYYNNAIISNIDATKPVLIPARQTVKIPVQVSIPAIKFGANLLNVLNKILSKTKVIAVLKGILYVENLRVNVEHNIELNLTA